MEIYYLSNQGEKIHLDREPYYMLDSSNIADYEWDYTTGKFNSISGFTKYMKSKKVDIAVISKNREEHKKNINNLLEIFDSDILIVSSGKLYIDDYYLPCYFVKSEKENRYTNGRKVIVNFSVIIEKNMWIKETLVRFRYSDDKKEATPGKGYPYGYVYDYAAGAGHASLLKNDVFDSTEFVLIIYGYAQNPSITIGGNVYSLNCTIQEGDRLIIHSQEKTITLIRSNDIRENYFRYRESGKNIFEKLPAGSDIPVYWNTDFDFDLWTIEERSEPLWT